MQRFPFLALAGAALLLLLPACGGSGSEIAGTWVLDTDAMTETMLAKMPQDQRENPMVQGMLQMFDKMEVTLVFKGDGTCTGDANMPGQEEEKSTGTWKLEGGRIVATMKGKDGKEETQKLEPKGDHLEMKPQGEGSRDAPVMIFRRR